MELLEIELLFSFSNLALILSAHDSSRTCLDAGMREVVGACSSSNADSEAEKAPLYVELQVHACVSGGVKVISMRKDTEAAGFVKTETIEEERYNAIAKSQDRM